MFFPVSLPPSLSFFHFMVKCGQAHWGERVVPLSCTSFSIHRRVYDVLPFSPFLRFNVKMNLTRLAYVQRFFFDAKCLPLILKYIYIARSNIKVSPNYPLNFNTVLSSPLLKLLHSSFSQSLDPTMFLIIFHARTNKRT